MAGVWAVSKLVCWILLFSQELSDYSVNSLSYGLTAALTCHVISFMDVSVITLSRHNYSSAFTCKYSLCVSSQHISQNGSQNSGWTFDQRIAALRQLYTMQECRLTISQLVHLKRSGLIYNPSTDCNAESKHKHYKLPTHLFQRKVTLSFACVHNSGVEGLTSILSSLSFSYPIVH